MLLIELLALWVIVIPALTVTGLLAASSWLGRRAGRREQLLTSRLGVIAVESPRLERPTVARRARPAVRVG